MKSNCKCICLEDACRPDAEQEDELFFEDDRAAPIVWGCWPLAIHQENMERMMIH